MQINLSNSAVEHFFGRYFGLEFGKMESQREENGGKNWQRSCKKWRNVMLGLIVSNVREKPMLQKYFCKPGFYFKKLSKQNLKFYCFCHSHQYWTFPNRRQERFSHHAGKKKKKRKDHKTFLIIFYTSISEVISGRRNIWWVEEGNTTNIWKTLSFSSRTRILASTCLEIFR